MFAEVRFRLDDSAGGNTVGRGALENRAEQLAGDALGVAIVERSGKRRRDTRTPRSWRGVLGHS
jgi:hypothetical protein